MPSLETLARALAGMGHETRLRLLVLLKDSEPLSPSDARRLLDGYTLGSIAHHFRSLHAAGLIRQTHTRPVRGAVEHFYVLTDLGHQLTDDLRL